MFGVCVSAGRLKNKFTRNFYTVRKTKKNSIAVEVVESQIVAGCLKSVFFRNVF
jgi:hypothetical protein